MNFLIPTLIAIDWLLWSVLLAALLYALVTMVATGRPTTLSVVLLGFGLLFAAALGLLLYWLAQGQSLTGLTVLAVLLGWPLSAVLTPLSARLLTRHRAGSPGGENVAG